MVQTNIKARKKVSHKCEIMENDVVKPMEREIGDWIKLLAESEAIPENIVALDFGMFETEDGYALYFCGASEYDEDDDDWACDPEYMPEDKYLMFTGEPYADMDWEEFLDNALEAIKKALAKKDEKVADYLGDRILTTGFDEGDLVRIN